MKHAGIRAASLCLALILMIPSALAYTKLKKGDSGAEVLAMQKALKSLGYTLSADGKYGAGTVNIVKQFQKKNGLTADGVAGNKTLSLLYSMAKGGPTPTAAPGALDENHARVTTGGGSLKLRAKKSTAANAAVRFPELLAVWGKELTAPESAQTTASGPIREARALSGLLRVHLTFTGRVQHVGFRVTAFDTARKLGLTGWVRNCPRPDMTEAEVQGLPGQVEDFVRKMQEVPRFAVRHVARYDCPVKEDETYFSIR